MKKQFKNNSKTIQKLLLVALLLTISVTGFYACKKQVEEIPDPNEKYKGEIKTYHESQDYKNLVINYPNSTLRDLSIVDANDKMKVIVTEITSNSGQVLKAITLFEPKVGFNNWFPTILIKVESESGSIKEMLDNNDFNGTVELMLTDNAKMSYVKLAHNKGIYENKLINDIKIGLSQSGGSANGGKVMVVDTGSGLKECLIAANECASETINGMGWIAYVKCCATLPLCIAEAYADCFITEGKCLGIPKPIFVE